MAFVRRIAGQQSVFFAISVLLHASWAESPRHSASLLRDDTAAKGILGERACYARLWKDAALACTSGAQCSVDGVMPYSRGACVQTEDGAAQCWDVCNPNHTAADYAHGKAGARNQLRVVQARRGLLGDVSCPCSFEESQADVQPAALTELGPSLNRGQTPQPVLAEAAEAWEKPGRRYFDPDILLELKCVHCMMAAAGRDYFVSEGTLLAAARNGFLLPWDADGDIVFHAQDEVDYDAFYRIFSPGFGAGTHSDCGGECQNLTVVLFTPKLTDHGRELHFWQAYSDIVAGTPVTLDGEKFTASREVRQRLQEIAKEPNPARLLYTPDPTGRTSGRGYLDVAPYEIDKARNELTIWELPKKKLKADAIYPLNKNCSVVAFGEAQSMQRLDLACPQNPAAYLDITYADADWRKEAYNRFDEQLAKWVHDPKGNLTSFLRKDARYDGPLVQNGLEAAASTVPDRTS
eukprot:TRINITY_DN123265_c0_g1_i1.p1 TRINITY_DN123265_c0_g1~~TRINITY_DN123265_c0_g1_i1.p1  ORF type:complete len:464 (+),score=65.81 TRINITY_DN123265_c0_g1_i1:143-1534(+)